MRDMSDIMASLSSGVAPITAAERPVSSAALDRPLDLPLGCSTYSKRHEGHFPTRVFSPVAKLLQTGAYARLYASPLTSVEGVPPCVAMCVVSWKPAQK